MRQRIGRYLLCWGMAVTVLIYITSLVAYLFKQPYLANVGKAVAAEHVAPVAQYPAADSSTLAAGGTAAASSEPPSEELLWLARCIYSETKRPVEQLLVAWVIRNRVETQYHGQDSYKEVVLEPYQFSAFNPNKNLPMPTVQSDSLGWKETMRIARYVMHASPVERPFSIITRHFYSEQSMPNGKPPHWTKGLKAQPITAHDIDRKRFRFYTGIL